MRVIGIDPGTVSIDLCGLDAGEVFLDRSLPTEAALADPRTMLDLIEAAAPIDLVAGPSGYGLPLVSGRDLTETDVRLACLAPAQEPGGIGGLGALMRALACAPAPVVFTPGVIHLPSVPAHRKVNRIDMGTADKVCAVALGVHEQIARHGGVAGDASFVFLELGGAFAAALAVERGVIVDGLGGSAGPMGLRAAGALDGEVAYLAGTVSKAMLFQGGATAIAGVDGMEAITAPRGARGEVASAAFLESAAKAVAALLVSAPSAREVIVSGRVSQVPGIADGLRRRLAPLRELTVHPLRGFAREAAHAAQGAALVADGLAGGRSAPIVEALGLRQASGTVLDHLHVISSAAARARLGLR